MAIEHFEPQEKNPLATIEVLGLNLDERRFPEARVSARKASRIYIRDRDRARHDGDEVAMRDALDVLRNQSFADVWQSMPRQAVLPGADLVPFPEGALTLER